MRLQVSKSCRHLKVPLEFENHHQALSGNCWQPSVPGWLSSRDFSSLPWGTPILLTGWRLSPESEITERKRDSKTEGLVLYNLIPETDTPSHLLYVPGHTDEPRQHAKRPHEGVGDRGRGLWGHLRGWLPQEGTEDGEVHSWKNPHSRPLGRCAHSASACTSVRCR